MPRRLGGKRLERVNGRFVEVPDIGPKYRTLSEELAELERTDPAVRKAAENYDRTVARILARPQDDSDSRDGER